jgi:hypothetical protein
MAGRKRLQCAHPPLIMSRHPPVRLLPAIRSGGPVGRVWGSPGYLVGLVWCTPGRPVGLVWGSGGRIVRLVCGTRQVTRPGQGMPPYAPRRYYADILGNCAYSEEDCAEIAH